MDGIIQAASGLMMTSGAEGQPPVRVGVPFADLTTPLFAVIAIVSAVHQTRREGVGQFLDASMFGALTSLVAAEPFYMLESLGIPMRSGNSVPRLSPFGIYQAADGWVSISAGGEGMFAQVVEMIGHPELATDDRFAQRPNRARNYQELDAEITAWTSQHPVAEIVDDLERRGVAVSAVRTPHEAETDPIAVERGDTVLVEHPTAGFAEDVYAPGFPVVFSGSHVAYDRPAPLLGEHNEDVYGKLLGYSAEHIAELQSAGVI
jgi:crotonobetainyl-CoA:carnitine CoA-transferase CaiB-like acyl-CoA transferase